EVAVDAFLTDRIAWKEIIPVVAAVMDGYVDDAPTTLEDLMDNDAAARRRATEIIAA
ncbi:MAG: 1-deoxy-D-xylulose-5-phosphate reductoisomerase, partial [Acidobacteriota bacterium]|nr:1-deoxy-D-xylulose-5-phosphate reductoisomerase [Acidobacteriota bacterium]